MFNTRQFAVNLIVIFSLIYLQSQAQTYIGVSLNIGNRVKFTPKSDGLQSPMMPSANVFVNLKRTFKHEWTILYGANFGILGYNIKSHAIDTLHPPSSIHLIFSSPDYSTIYGKLTVVPGKQISINSKTLLIGLGGGISYSYSPSEATEGISTFLPNGKRVEVYHAETIPSNKITALAKAVMQLQINKLITLGIEYSRHFSSCLHGHYEFYYTENQSAGKIELYQSEFSLVCMFRVSNNKI
jgi:hypothetical protein